MEHSEAIDKEANISNVDHARGSDGATMGGHDSPARSSSKRHHHQGVGAAPANGPILRTGEVSKVMLARD